MATLCKCGKELITAENKIDFTVIVSAVSKEVEVIDCYKCNDCKTVVGRTRKYNKESVLKILEELDCVEAIKNISGS